MHISSSLVSPYVYFWSTAGTSKTSWVGDTSKLNYMMSTTHYLVRTSAVDVYLFEAKFSWILLSRLLTIVKLMSVSVDC